MDSKDFHFLLPVLLLIASFSFAEAPGKITGCVSDDSGGFLPGVTVEISGPSLAKKITVYTDETGCFQAAAIPAGKFDVAFKLSGFATITKNDVIVFAGRESIVDKTMRISVSAEITVRARKPLRDIVEETDNLVGVANASSEGAVRSETLALKPLLKPAELLEEVPGVVISQHSGQGKANQYYLRGLNLDHGTDLAITVADIPANFPSHGHGQGYIDLNFLMPELVNDIQFKKGPYFADEGDFSSAGAVEIDYANVLDRKIAGVEGGNYDYGRAVVAGSPKIGKGNLLAAMELFYNNGPWDHPDDYRKINGLLRYSRSGTQDQFNITGMGYDGQWNSTDQVPLRTLEDGSISRFGTVDPTDGGDSYRYSLSGSWRHLWKDAATDVSAYWVRYRLNLFSNFTFFLNDPANGDQFEQTDDRTVTGFQTKHHWIDAYHGIEAENLIGFQLRNDDIGDLDLYHTKGRERLSATRIDQVQERSWSGFAQSSLRWSEKLRSIVGLRADYFTFDVDSNISVNSGKESAAIVSPKLTMIFGPWSKTEYYFNFGYGFHSNDARGTTITVDPVSQQPVQKVDPLVRTKGAEVGVRCSRFKNWQTTFSLFLLDFDSELLFLGDAGITEPSRPSRRVGFEWSNFFKPYSWLTLDVSWANSRGRFRDPDPAGDRIPGAVEGIFTAGFNVENLPPKFGPFGHTVGVIKAKNGSGQYQKGIIANLILGMYIRRFGGRPLIEDNSVRSDPSTLVNLSLGYKVSPRWNAFVDFFNLFDAKTSDIDYYYTSRLAGEPSQGVNDIHTHPVEPLTLRISITRSW